METVTLQYASDFRLRLSVENKLNPHELGIFDNTQPFNIFYFSFTIARSLNLLKLFNPLFQSANFCVIVREAVGGERDRINSPINRHVCLELLNLILAQKVATI